MPKGTGTATPVPLFTRDEMAPKNLKVKLAIKSCHRNADRRQAQLDTWLPELDADFFFLVGKPVEDIPDVLSIPVSDAFEDIAPKVHAACHYALNENTDFLCILDDDTYLRPERLLNSNFWKADYIGFMRTSGLFYNQEIPYAQGSCLWLSRRAMEHVLRSKVMVPGVIDDGALGRALVDRVQFTHDYRYYPGPVPEVRPLPENKIISTHKCLPPQMRWVHEDFKKRNSIR